MINLDDTRAGKVNAYWIPNFNSLKRFGMLSCTWAFMASPPVDMSCILENAIYAQACAYAEVGKEIKQSSHCYNIFFQERGSMLDCLSHPNLAWSCCIFFRDGGASCKGGGRQAISAGTGTSDMFARFFDTQNNRNLQTLHINVSKILVLDSQIQNWFWWFKFNHLLHQYLQLIWGLCCKL